MFSHTLADAPAFFNELARITECGILPTVSSHRHSGSEDDPSFNATKRTTWEVVRRVATYLRPYKHMAAANILCALVSLGFSLIYPQLVQNIIDDIVAGTRTNFFWPAAGLAGAFLFRDLFNCVRIIINNIFEQNVIYDIRRDVFSRLHRLPINYFDQRASGDLMTRVIDEVNAMERVLIDGTEQGTIALLSVIGVMALLLRKNLLLALIALAPFPVLTAGTLWYTLTAHNRYRAQRVAASAMSAFLMDSLQGVRQIKAFGRQGHEDARFAQKADALRTTTLRLMKVWALYSPAMTFSASLGIALVLWIGGSQVSAGRLTVGQLVSFVLYLGMFYEPLGKLHGLNQMLQSARAAGERVFDIMDATEERASAVAIRSQKRWQTNLCAGRFVMRTSTLVTGMAGPR